MSDELIMKSLKYLFDIAEKSISADLAKYQVDKNAETQKILQNNKFKNQQTLKQLEFEYAILEEDYSQSKSELNTLYQNLEKDNEISREYLNEIGQSIFGTEDGQQLIDDLGQSTLDSLKTTLAETDSQKNNIDRYKEAIAKNKKSSRVLDKALKDRQKFAEAGMQVGMQEDISLANALNRFSESDLEDKFIDKYVDFIKYDEDNNLTPVWNENFQSFIYGANLAKDQQLKILQDANKWMEALTTNQELQEKYSGAVKFENYKKTGKKGYETLNGNFGRSLKSLVSSFSSQFQFTNQNKQIDNIGTQNKSLLELNNLTEKSILEPTNRQQVTDKISNFIFTVLKDNVDNDEIEELLENPELSSRYKIERLMEVFHVPINNQSRELFVPPYIDKNIEDKVGTINKQKVKTIESKDGNAYKTKDAYNANLHFFSDDINKIDIEKIYEGDVFTTEDFLNFDKEQTRNVLNQSFDILYSIYTYEDFINKLETLKNASGDKKTVIPYNGKEYKESYVNKVIYELGTTFAMDLEPTIENSIFHNAIENIDNELSLLNVESSNNILKGIMNTSELGPISSEEIIENIYNTSVSESTDVNTNLELGNNSLNAIINNMIPK